MSFAEGVQCTSCIHVYSVYITHRWVVLRRRCVRLHLPEILTRDGRPTQSDARICLKFPRSAKEDNCPLNNFCPLLGPSRGHIDWSSMDDFKAATDRTFVVRFLSKIVRSTESIIVRLSMRRGYWFCPVFVRSFLQGYLDRQFILPRHLLPPLSLFFALFLLAVKGIFKWSGIVR